MWLALFASPVSLFDVIHLILCEIMTISSSAMNHTLLKFKGCFGGNDKYWRGAGIAAVSVCGSLAWAEQKVHFGLKQATPRAQTAEAEKRAR